MGGDLKAGAIARLVGFDIQPVDHRTRRQRIGKLGEKPLDRIAPPFQFQR
jgi:hypothetical protein